MFFVDLQLFDSQSIIEECILRDKYKITVMLNTGSDDYEFINLAVAQKTYETLKIESVELIKYRIAKKYDDKINPFITHVIYSKMTIVFYSKSLTSLMITFLTNHSVILDGSWMMKHEMIIDVAAASFEKKILKGKKNHCTHFGVFGFYFFFVPSQKLEKSTIKESSTGRFMKIFFRNAKSSKIIFDKKGLFAIARKDLDLFKKKTSVKRTNVLRKKQKRMLNESGKSIELSKNIESKQKNIKVVINIAIIDAILFNLLMRRKNVEIFVVNLKNINFEMKKRKKKMIDFKTVMSEKYHDFLNVFSKQKTDKLSSHGKYNHRIKLEKEKKTPN